MQSLTQYFSKELVDQQLIPFDRYCPYPKIGQRSFWEGRSSRVRQFYLSEGEAALSFQWLSVEATTFLEFYRSGDRVKNETQNFSKRKALGALVLAECFEHQGRFLEQIINGVWSICEETTWAISAHLKFRGQRDLLPDPTFEQALDLFSLETAQLIAFTDYILGEELDLISKAVTRRMRKELEERVFLPFLTRDDYWWMGYGKDPLNNWTPWCVCNALSAILLSCQQEDLRKRAIEKSVKSLDFYLESVPQDGSCDEGTSYWMQAGLRAIQAIDLLCGAVECDKKILQSEKMIHMGRFMMNNHIDENWYVNFADGAAKLAVTIPCALFYLSCVLEDSDLEGEAVQLFSQHQGLETVHSGYDPGRVMMNVIYYDELSQRTTKPNLQKTVWYPGTQVMISREQACYGKGLFLAAKGGHNGESHNHNDVGNFIVFKEGKPVIIDVGVGVYTRQTFGPERYSIWTMNSSYHNLPLPKGGQQLPGKDYGAGETTFTTDAQGDVLSLDLSGAYGLEQGTLHRTICFDRNNQEIRITDRVKKGLDCQWMLMTAQRPEIEDGQFCVGGCTVGISDGMIALEPIQLTDQKLNQVWGDTVYRVIITGETDKQTILIR